MTKQTVYVVGYEGNNHCATSGFWWSIDNNDTKARFNELNEEFKDTGVSVYKGEMQVVNTDSDLITEEVRKFLEDNDWENAFKTETIS